MLLPSKKVTIDITSDSIRLLMVRGKRIDKWASAPLEQGLIEDGIITSPLLLAEKIKRLMAASGIHAKKVIASVNGVYSIFRLVTLPMENGHSREEIMNNTAESIMPIAPENFYITWQILSSNGKSSQALLIGMQPGVVDPEMEAFKAAKLNPYFINLKAMALLKLIDQTEGLVVNVESQCADIALLAEGIPYVIRTVSRKNGISAADWAKEVAVLLQQTVMFADSRYHLGLSDIDIKCYLAGRMADSEIVSGIVQDVSGYTPGELSIPLEYSPNLPLNQYAVNIGLALKKSQIPQVIDIPVDNTEEPIDAEVLLGNENDA